MKRFNIIKFLFVLLLLVCAQTSGIVFAVENETVNSEGQIQRPLVAKITFEDVINKAKEHSYDLKIADYNVLISKQGIRGARSEYFPKLNANIGTEYTKNFRDANESTVMSIGDAFINPYTRYQSVMGITVGYNLFDFGVRGGNLKIAKEDAELKQLETKQKLQELYLTLLDSYTKLLITSDQIEKNKEILKYAQKNLDCYERLFKVKEISKTELNNERVRVNTIKVKLAELKAIQQESISWLSFYTGEEYDIDKLKISEIKAPNFDINAQQDYQKSIVWKIYEKNIKKKELELAVVKRNNYPKLNLYGKYYLYGSDPSRFGSSLSNIEPSNFSVGAALNMPFFDGMKNRSNIEKTRLELKQMNVERDKAMAQWMTKIACMQSNALYLDSQIKENSKAVQELTEKEKSVQKLVSKRIVAPMEEYSTKIELLNQKIELDKNTITRIAVTKGIEILTEEL